VQTLVGRQSCNIVVLFAYWHNVEVSKTIAYFAISRAFSYLTSSTEGSDPSVEDVAVCD
jgi:hypothetical protein